MKKNNHVRKNTLHCTQCHQPIQKPPKRGGKIYWMIIIATRFLPANIFFVVFIGGFLAVFFESFHMPELIGYLISLPAGCFSGFYFARSFHRKLMALSEEEYNIQCAPRSLPDSHRHDAGFIQTGTTDDPYSPTSPGYYIHGPGADNRFNPCSVDYYTSGPGSYDSFYHHR